MSGLNQQFAKLSYSIRVPGVRIPPSPRGGCECGCGCASEVWLFIDGCGCVIGNLIAMFDFEKLEVYQVIKSQNLKVLTFISKSTSIDIFLKDQWKRASLSILLNLAEGTGRMSVQDKKHFYTLARGSVFECVAILDILHEMELIDNEFFQDQGHSASQPKQ